MLYHCLIHVAACESSAALSTAVTVFVFKNRGITILPLCKNGKAYKVAKGLFLYNRGGGIMPPKGPGKHSRTLWRLPREAAGPWGVLFYSIRSIRRTHFHPRTFFGGECIL